GETFEGIGGGTERTGAAPGGAGIDGLLEVGRELVFGGRAVDVGNVPVGLGGAVLLIGVQQVTIDLLGLNTGRTGRFGSRGGLSALDAGVGRVLGVSRFIIGVIDVVRRAADDS